MKTMLYGILCLLFSGAAAAQEKDVVEKLPGSSRPGFFHELKDAEILCMANCPSRLESVFGLKLVCGNFEAETYKSACSNISSKEPVEYCNCFKGDCSKFKVLCQVGQRTCAVELLNTGLAPASCQCNGNSCEPPPGNFAEATCFMREVPSTKVCEIERQVAFAAGRTYQISCKEDEPQCASEGVQIRNEDTTPNLSLPKPGEPK